MGNSCGQYCSKEGDEPSELLTVDNKVTSFVTICAITLFD